MDAAREDQAQARSHGYVARQAHERATAAVDRLRRRAERLGDMPLTLGLVRVKAMESAVALYLKTMTAVTHLPWPGLVTAPGKLLDWTDDPAVAARGD